MHGQTLKAREANAVSAYLEAAKSDRAWVGELRRVEAARASAAVLLKQKEDELFDLFRSRGRIFVAAGAGVVIIDRNARFIEIAPLDSL